VISLRVLGLYEEEEMRKRTITASQHNTYEEREGWRPLQEGGVCCSSAARAGSTAAPGFERGRNFVMCVVMMRGKRPGMRKLVLVLGDWDAHELRGSSLGSRRRLVVVSTSVVATRSR